MKSFVYVESELITIIGLLDQARKTDHFLQARDEGPEVGMKAE